jgi:hypothetical protein
MKYIEKYLSEEILLTRECTNFIVFGLTRLGLEHAIYNTPGEHANKEETIFISAFNNAEINIVSSSYNFQIILMQK